MTFIAMPTKAGIGNEKTKLSSLRKQGSGQEMNEGYFVYIRASRKNTVLYTGVTSNLMQRVWQHKQGIIGGFTKRYNVNKLVYFEQFQDIKEAIHREKCIKRWKRVWKEELIATLNPDWSDLYTEQIEQVPASAGMTR